jgi:hypothetical protein
MESTVTTLFDGEGTITGNLRVAPGRVSTERGLEAAPVGSATGRVSAPVARQMLHLLGDNEVWTSVPSSEEMGVWATIRNASPDELDVLASYYPEQCEAYRHALKHWGLDWLRGIVEKAWVDVGERLDAIVAEAAVADLPTCDCGRHLTMVVGGGVEAQLCGVCDVEQLDYLTRGDDL